MYVFPLLHFRLMENLTQKDPVWRENGKAFVESVTRLLERLLDYRNVGQVGTFLPFFHLNPILHGLLKMRYHMGGSKRSPYQNPSKLFKLGKKICFGKN